MNWEPSPLGLSSDNTLPPLGPGNPIPSTPDRTGRPNGPFNNLQSFNFSTPRRGIPLGQFQSAPLGSSPPISQSAPSGTGLSEHNPLPLARFCHDQDQPWNPIANDPAPSAKRGVASQTARPDFDARAYRSPPQSELESIDTSIYQSDSGYHTHSIRSAELADCAQDLSSHFTDQINTILTPFTLNMPPISTPTSDLPEVQHLSRTPSSRSKGPLQTCGVCGETPKCPSDFKYAHPGWFVLRRTDRHLQEAYV